MRQMVVKQPRVKGKDTVEGRGSSEAWWRTKMPMRKGIDDFFGKSVRGACRGCARSNEHSMSRLSVIHISK